MKRTLYPFFFLFLVCPMMAQEVQIDVAYKMKRHPAFKFKTGRPMEITMIIADQTYVAKPVSKDLKRWDIRANGYLGEAQFYREEDKGIWWEIASVDVNTKILLSTDPTDTNDPREFVITSDADRGRFLAFNDEPDCNSEFTLMEPADSPTRLTGVAKTFGRIVSDKPCDKGTWELQLEEMPPEHILLGWVFSVIQSSNVRFMEK